MKELLAQGPEATSQKSPVPSSGVSKGEVCGKLNDAKGKLYGYFGESRSNYILKEICDIEY